MTHIKGPIKVILPSDLWELLRKNNELEWFHVMATHAMEKEFGDVEVLLDVDEQLPWMEEPK